MERQERHYIEFKEYTLEQHTAKLAQYQLLLDKLLPVAKQHSFFPEKKGRGPLITKLDSNGRFLFAFQLCVITSDIAFLECHFAQSFQDKSISIEFNPSNGTVNDSAQFNENDTYMNIGHIQAYGVENIPVTLNRMAQDGEYRLA